MSGYQMTGALSPLALAMMQQYSPTSDPNAGGMSQYGIPLSSMQQAQQMPISQQALLMNSMGFGQ